MKHIKLDQESNSDLAALIAEARIAASLSQDEICNALGYKSGQFISNIERGKCSIPTNKIPLVSDLLSIDEGRLIDAILSDRKKRIKITCNNIRSEQGSKADGNFMEGTRRDIK